MQYGLLGRSLAHSYSVPVHRLLGDYDYKLVNLEPDQLEGFLTDRKFLGINVTIPYKQAVIPHCAALDPVAHRIGSVNTITLKEDGSLHGSNTDYYGFGYMARYAGISFAGKKVMILGSGGTSLTAQTYVADAGAREIVVVSRTGEVNYNNILDHCNSDIIINTTPVGMYPKSDQKLVDLNNFPKCRGVIDAIYNPLYTRLYIDALERGIPAVNGLPMLVAQAKLASELFTGSKIADSRIEEAVESITGDLRNIVLIGMPGSGKTELGRLIAEAGGREFVDVDSEIIAKAEMDIPQIFSKFGEAGFRKIESEVISGLGTRTGLVVATGGGSILSHENYLNLKQNSLLVYIRRDISKLATGGRPLSTDMDRLHDMYTVRQPLYERYGDAKVDNNGEIEMTIKRLVEVLNENSCN